MKCNYLLIILLLFFFNCKKEQESDPKFIPFSNQNPKIKIPNLKIRILTEKDSFKKANIYFSLGKEFHKLNLEDSAFHYYKLSKNLYHTLRNPMEYDVGYFMHRILESKNGAVIDTTRVYLKEFYNYAIQKHSDIRLALALKEYGDIEVFAGNMSKAHSFYKKALIYSNLSDSVQLSASLNSNYGFTSINSDSLKFYYFKSLNLSKKIKYNEGIFKVYNNLGTFYKNNKNLDSALIYYQKAEAIKLNSLFQVQQSILFANMKDLYKKTNDEKLYTTYSIKYDSIENILKENQQIGNIANVEISSLKKLTMNYQENKILYFILIGMVFLIAMYSLIRWKKVDYRRRKLTEEKESLQIEHIQTIQELEKVKQLVIEDHIVLKNKAKIYLNDLLYIKAEDHYLQLFTSKKKEFVRGKISEIINELPPNFVQTHRSYIVNKNLIISQTGTSVFLEGKIEIPLSRNFKKNVI